MAKVTVSTHRFVVLIAKLLLTDLNCKRKESVNTDVVLNAVYVAGMVN